MPRATTFVIETTGGAPVFHIPFPISTMGILASGSAPGPSHGPPEPEEVKFIFRNTGGTPTFHVGGSEIGISANDAWDYATVARAVIQGRAEGKGARAPSVDGVRVKMEEETPRVLLKDKGKERKTANNRRTERQYSREEVDALARGTLSIDTIEETYEEGRRDFAVYCDPALPPSRPLSEEEEAEWKLVWEAFLRLDRLFSGPLRDFDALHERLEKLMKDGAQRAHDRQQKQAPDKEPDEVVEATRLALRPLHQGMLSRSQESPTTAVAPQRTRTPDKKMWTMPGESRAKSATEFAAWLMKTGGTPRVLRNVKENAEHHRAGSGNTSGMKRSHAEDDVAEGPSKRPRQENMEPPAAPAALRRTSSTVAVQHIAEPAVPPEVKYYHKIKATDTPTGGGYTAWIPDSRAPPLTAAECKWLAAQTDLARAPNYWRPVRWLALGQRMYNAATNHPDNLRPLHHSVLLAAWDRGDWRFPGHERVGRPDIPWAVWIQSKEGRRWRSASL